MKPENRRLRDPRELRALSHPVRIGILELLSVRGAMTATELGDALDESPANCSWHLRKLAEHELVEEADGGTGRQRPWQAIRLGLSWAEDEVASDEEAIAGNALAQMMSQRWLDRFHDSLLRARRDSAAWSDARALFHGLTWLTAEELAEVGQALDALAGRHRERMLDPGSRPDGARLVEIVGFAGPVELGEQP